MPSERFQYALGMASGRHGMRRMRLPSVLLPGLRDALVFELSLFHRLLEGGVRGIDKQFLATCAAIIPAPVAPCLADLLRPCWSLVREPVPGPVTSGDPRHRE